MDLWIIEKRHPDGILDFSEPQPESVFGMAAITGISSEKMARAIYRSATDPVLSGDRIAAWPSVLQPNWIARRKTW